MTNTEADLFTALLNVKARSGLIDLPPVVAKLENQHGRQTLVRAAMRLARIEAIELRPHSGVYKLSEDDKSRSPRGLGGSVLSVVRIL